MNDQNNNGESEWATPSGWSAERATPSSIAEPVLIGDYGTSAPPEAPTAPPASKLPWFAAVAGALVLLVGGGFFALTAFAATGGAATPEEAVDALIEAANNEDFITIAELLEPGERRTVAEPVITEVMPELIRLGVLNDSADAGNVEGFEWEFTDITYRVENMASDSDMVHVYFTGGQAAAEFNAAEFPFGDSFRERFGDEIQDEPRVTEVVEDDGHPMVLVERDGRWYMSAMFTIAENVRLDADERLPELSEVPPALGSASPEAAVEAMFAEMVEMDLAGLIGRMDPDELAVLYRYAPLFLEEGQFELNEIRFEMDDAGVTWDIRDFDFDVEVDGDDAIVTIRGFTVDIESDDFDLTFSYAKDQIRARVDIAEFGRGSLDATPSRWVIEGVVDGESFNIEVDVDSESRNIDVTGTAEDTSFSGDLTLDDDGVCSSYSVTASDGTDESGCLEDELYGASGDFLVQQYIGVFDRLDNEFAGVPIATRKTNGVWYVAPVTTTMNYYVNALQDLDEGQFEQMLDSMVFATDFGFGAIGTVGTMEEDFFLDEGTMPSDDFGGGFEEFDDATQEFDDSEFEWPETTDGGDFGQAVPDFLDDLSLAKGETVVIDGEILEGTYDVIGVKLSAGDVVTVTVEADPGSNLDTTVEIFGPTGSVGYNDDAESEVGVGLLDSHLETRVDHDSFYTIEVHGFADLGSGSYTLTVARG